MTKRYLGLINPSAKQKKCKNMQAESRDCIILGFEPGTFREGVQGWRSMLSVDHVLVGVFTYGGASLPSLLLSSL